MLSSEVSQKDENIAVTTLPVIEISERSVICSEEHPAADNTSLDVVLQYVWKFGVIISQPFSFVCTQRCIGHFSGRRIESHITASIDANSLNEAQLRKNIDVRSTGDLYTKGATVINIRTTSSSSRQGSYRENDFAPRKLEATPSIGSNTSSGSKNDSLPPTPTKLFSTAIKCNQEETSVGIAVKKTVERYFHAVVVSLVGVKCEENTFAILS